MTGRQRLSPQQRWRSRPLRGGCWLLSIAETSSRKSTSRAGNLRSDQTSWGTDVMVSPWGGAGGVMLTLSGAR